MENLHIYLIMALLGYAAFVFIAESFNPFASKRRLRSHGPDLSFRHWVGVISGLIIGFSSIATRFFPTPALVDQLKVSIIAALVVLLPFLLLVGLVRFFSRRQDDFVDTAKASINTVPATESHNLVTPADQRVDTPTEVSTDASISSTERDEPAAADAELAVLNQQQMHLEQQHLDAEAARQAAIESHQQDEHLAEERRIEALRTQEKERLHQQWEEKQAAMHQQEQARLEQEQLQQAQAARRAEEQHNLQASDEDEVAAAIADTGLTETAGVAATMAEDDAAVDLAESAPAANAGPAMYAVSAGGTPTPELLSNFAGEITVLQDGLGALRTRAEANEQQVSRLADLSDEQIRCQRQIDSSRDELEKVRYMQIEAKEREVFALKTQQEKRESTLASMQRVIDLQKKQIAIAASNSERQQNLARQAANVARQAAQQRQQAQRRAEQEKVARQKMELSAKRAVGIARDAVTKLAVQERGA